MRRRHRQRPCEGRRRSARIGVAQPRIGDRQLRVLESFHCLKNLAVAVSVELVLDLVWQQQNDFAFFDQLDQVPQRVQIVVGKVKEREEYVRVQKQQEAQA